MVSIIMFFHLVATLLLSVEPDTKMPFNDKFGDDVAVNPFMSNIQKETQGDYNHNGIKDEHDGLVFSDYENCTIDNYLENDFYVNMRGEIKGAIIEKDIEVSCRGYDYLYTVSTIRRHVYLSDAKDWKDLSVSRGFHYL